MVKINSDKCYEEYNLGVEDKPQWWNAQKKRGFCVLGETGKTGETDYKVPICTHHSLIRNMRFVLNEKLPQNASRFAILLEYENPRSFFLFFISCYFIFPLMNAVVYIDIDQSIH